ncbi:hypothetical protein PHYBOEH_010478 [Phytophthora boehmeriae]|uniref:Uncharacterized protein n=1 Tax=Phytophthora boehmeriae TaxID=109152 RepID=A0A8T1VSL0_9STRA|nr:hypothetical protein PHYBOEH_010478 [Phytophthora boehmeriae]
MKSLDTQVKGLEDSADDLSAWANDAKIVDFDEKEPMMEEEGTSLTEEEEQEAEMIMDMGRHEEDSEESEEDQEDDVTQWEPSREEQSNLEQAELEENLHPNDPIEEELSEEAEYLERMRVAFAEELRERRASGLYPLSDKSYTFDAFLERQRRLNSLENDQQDAPDEVAGGDTEHMFVPTEEVDDEEETLPVIPGLTDVELIAFNAEFANEEVLDKIIDWSYDQVAAMSSHRDNFIHVDDLYQFLLKTLNPLDEEIAAEDEDILNEAVAELRKQQGLEDDSMVVYRGFIARGMPLRFLQSLAHKMHTNVQARRLQSVAARDEL